MQQRARYWRSIGWTLFSLIAVSCTAPQPASPSLASTTSPRPIASPEATMTAPAANEPAYWPTAGWRTSTPEEQGMDAQKLAKMVAFIQDETYAIHRVTIIRHGYLVTDATFYPFDLKSKHNIHSVTKSINSALIGIAIQQGVIDSVEQPVLSFFPDRTVANRDADKEAMTLEHLLTMTSGLECRDSYLYRWRGLNQMRQTDDWVQFILDLPMAEPPGTKFEYCNGASFLLAAIIQETTDMSAADFAAAHLFGPLGITDFAWPANAQGINIGWGEMRLHPLDMAKIGYLYLNAGRWDRRQIIDAEWVAASMRPFVAGTLADSYGYQWWVDDEGYTMALGYAGQYIVVAPEQDLVVVFTSNLPEQEFARPQTLLDIFIIPAILSDAPLPANPAAFAKLETQIEQAARPPAPTDSPPLPATARRISGRTYSVDPNPYHIWTVSLTFEQEAEALLQLVSSPDDEEPLSEREASPLLQEYPIGLDGKYRFTSGDFDIPMGIEGSWLADDIFVIDFDYIGNTGTMRAKFTFDGDQISIQIIEQGQTLTQLSGRLQR